MSHVWTRHITYINESWNLCRLQPPELWHDTHQKWKGAFSCDGSVPSFWKALSYTWMSRVQKMYESCHTYEWVMLLIIMSHVTHFTHMNHTSKSVILHTWMSHVAHMRESCHTYQWVMSRTYMSQESCLGSCLTFKLVMSHVSMSHFTYMNESCHTRKWVIFWLFDPIHHL